MNSVLRGLYDKPLTAEDFAPGRIVSLWDMQEFYAHILVKICSELCFYQNFAKDWLKSGDTLAKKLSLPCEYVEKASALPKVLAHIGLSVSERSSETLAKYLTGQEEVKAHEFWASAEQVRWDIVNELESRLTLILDKNQAELYKDNSTFLGQEMIDEFRAILDDATEATRCFVFERYTACVFHLMRIIGYLVHDYAGKVGVDFDPENDSWGPILDRISKKVEKELKSKSAGKRTYTACCKSLDGLRPRRNGIMHHGDHYSKERANAVIGAVKVCLEQYSTLPDWSSCPRS